MSTARRWPHAGTLGMFALLLAAACISLRLQAGPWWHGAPPSGRIGWAIGALAAWLGGSAWLLRGARAATPADPAAGWIVAWASQTGFAQELAERSVAVLCSTGQAAHALPLERLDAATLANAQRVLFIASTTGEGDPPDHALAFVRDLMDAPTPAPLSLRYALLALGDRSYGHYCAFGRRLDAWLQHAGAEPLFDRVEVDNAAADALRHWQAMLAESGEQPSPLPDWDHPRYARWRLAARRQLNPGSRGGAVYQLSLLPADPAAPSWEPGDVAEIGPRHGAAQVQAWLAAHALDGEARIDGRTLRDWLAESGLPEVPEHDPERLVASLRPLPHRDYSIASAPHEQRLDLLVRLQHDAAGQPGLGSGWLCLHAAVGDAIALRVRRNPNFHAPATTTPLILIGNGTGIAGLRAHLAARVAAGARRTWLLFGERNAACDLHFGEELRRWQAQGWLERLDTVFSRDADAGEARYVQHRLAQAATELRAWVADGAAIYVCGSLRGMAPAVNAVLDEVLGAATRERLVQDGRYRRDVY